MSRIVVFGHGPMRWEASTRLFALALRSWHFANTLARAGHEVLLFAIRGHASEGWPPEKITRVRRGRVTVWSISEHMCHERPELIGGKIDEFSPSAIVGVNRDPAAVAVNFAGGLPFWADINGDPLAEAQVKASALGGDWNVNEWYRTLVPVLARGDHFSTCSRAQRHALIGQLGMLGRLTAKNDGYDFVSAVPNSIDDEELELMGRMPRRPRLPGERFVALWSGGFNTWTDPDVLFESIELAMDDAPELTFVSTGGAIGGHHTDAYQRFEDHVARSRHRKRYELAGWVQTAELPAYYAGAHAAILVDRFSYEGTLGARTRMLDWLAASLPIVATRLSEISLDVEQAGAGLLADCGDPRGLANALLTLVRDPEAARARGERGRCFAHEVCRAERQLAPLLEWARSPKRAPDLEHRLPLEWRPTLATRARKQANLLRGELQERGARETLDKASQLGWRKLRHGTERIASRLGLLASADLPLEPAAPEAPPLEAPRLAAFQWRERLASLKSMPKVAVLLLLEPTAEPHVLDWTLTQFELQYFQSFRLVIATLGEPPRPLAETLARWGERHDPDRVEVVRLGPTALAEHYTVSGADYVLLLAAGTLLRPDAIAELVTHADSSNAEIVFGLERVIDARGVPLEARPKQEFSPELLLAHSSLGPAVLYASRVFSFAATPPSECPADALLYDAALRSTERATRIVHLPHVLCQVWQSPHPESELLAAAHRTRAAELGAVREALLRRGLDATAEPGPVAGTFRVRAAPPKGDVLVVVPESRSKLRNARALASLRRGALGAHVQIVGVPGHEDFDVSSSGGSHRFIVFVDPGVEALHADWLDGLLSELALPHTATVSPKLVRRDGTTLWDGRPDDKNTEWWDIAQPTSAPHALVFATTVELLRQSRLPLDVRARTERLKTLAAGWRRAGLTLRYTPHSTFAVQPENGEAELRAPSGSDDGRKLAAADGDVENRWHRR